LNTVLFVGRALAREADREDEIMTIKSAATVAGLLSAVLLLAPLANAGSVFNFADVFPGVFSPDAPAQDGGFGAASANASLTSNFGGSTFSGAARASADFGVMRTFVTTTMTNFQPQSFFSPCTFDPSILCGRDPVDADSGFEDTLTITGGTGSAFLGLGFDVTGSAIWTTTAGDAFTQGALSVFQGTVSTGTFAFGEGFTGSTTVAGSIPFTYGTPFTFSVLFSAFAPVTDAFEMNNYDFAGTANYENTAKISLFGVFADADLQTEVSGIQVTAESGTNYAKLASVPEPSTLILLGVGILGAVRATSKRGPNR
jgi:hypothetical protein